MGNRPADGFWRQSPLKSMDMDFLLRKSGSPFALFAKDYELLRNGSVCCVLGFDDWKHAEIFVDGDRYVVRYDGKARWVLEHGGTSVAFCKRQASGSQLEFSIEFDDRVWRFKPDRKRLVLVHDVWEEELKIGRIAPRIRFWWSEVGATFDQAPRLEVVGFAVWIVGIHWVGIAGKLTAGRAEMGM